MFAFASPRPRRRPSLTPMIDVVFLLLVFFMLAARFGQDTALPVTLPAGGVADWQGAPRLIEVAPETLRLNGQTISPAGLAQALAALMPSPDAPVVLRARDGATLESLVNILDLLAAEGVTQVVVVE